MKNLIITQNSRLLRVNQGEEPGNFLRKMTFERITLYAPSTTVSLIANIRGVLDKKLLSEALIKIQMKHPLTRSRIIFDDNDTAWFKDGEVGKIPLKEFIRESESSWMEKIQQESRIPFKFSKGPLLRVMVVKGTDQFDLVLFAHHTICDGRALTILLRDILQFLEKPDHLVHPMNELPIIESSNLPTPLKNSRILHFIAEKVNGGWNKYNMRFTQTDYERIHANFWQEQNQLIPMSLNREQSNKLIQWCKYHNVKVHSMLCTAFYKAQGEIQPYKHYFKNLIMPLDVRSRLKQKVGDVFGFYATAAMIPIRYNSKWTFVHNVRRFHDKIRKELQRGDPFKTLKFDFLSPTLIDALYFEKFGYIRNPVVQKVSKLIKWNRMTTGMMISNLGKLSIPDSYGEYHINRVFAPSVITTRHEKYLGIATINGQINFLMTSRNSTIPHETVAKLCHRAISILLKEIE